MIKVGLRANNWPVEEEKAVLIQHIRAHFGIHHLEEIRLAFDMAVTRKLNLADKQISCYDQFTCEYFSLIMSAYRDWAAEQYKVLEKYLPTKDRETKKLLMPTTDWRGLVEEQFQKAVSKDTYKLFPVQFYDQVVTDGFIHPELYRDYLAYARKEICGELQLQLTSIISSDNPEDQSKIDRLQRLLNEYRAGNREYELITRAKQVSVWILFREAKRRKLQGLYERVDAPKLLQESY